MGWMDHGDGVDEGLQKVVDPFPGVGRHFEDDGVGRLQLPGQPTVEPIVGHTTGSIDALLLPVDPVGDQVMLVTSRPM